MAVGAVFDATDNGFRRGKGTLGLRVPGNRHVLFHRQVFLNHHIIGKTRGRGVKHRLLLGDHFQCFTGDDAAPVPGQTQAMPFIVIQAAIPGGQPGRSITAVFYHQDCRLITTAAQAGKHHLSPRQRHADMPVLLRALDLIEGFAVQRRQLDVLRFQTVIHPGQDAPPEQQADPAHHRGKQALQCDITHRVYSPG